MHSEVWLGNRKETTGNTRHRWEDNIKTDHLREVGWNSTNWIHLA
jgi:hypothetical protein